MKRPTPPWALDVAHRMGLISQFDDLSALDRVAILESPWRRLTRMLARAGRNRRDLELRELGYLDIGGEGES